MKWLSLIQFLIVFILSSSGFAKVQVAFFEYRTKDGQLRPIEPGGHLYHVAIQFGDHWLNAQPYHGVQIVNDVREMGQLFSVIEIDHDVPIEKYEVQIGKTFSVMDPWENPTSTYCSKLVAQILDIAPTMMKTRVGVGVSPDGLYRLLTSSPHREMRSCNTVFYN